MVLVKRLASPGFEDDEGLHLVGISGDDDDDAVAVVLHEFEQRVDRLAAEIPAGAAGSAGQRIGLVDEQNPIERGFAHVERLACAVCPTYPADEAGAVRLDQDALAQHVERAIDLAERARHLRLADARRSGKHHVAADGAHGQALARAASSRPRDRPSSLLTSSFTGPSPTIASSSSRALSAVRAERGTGFCRDAPGAIGQRGAGGDDQHRQEDLERAARCRVSRRSSAAAPRGD